MAKGSNIELIMISITGADQPGVTAALSEIIASHDAQILDIGQADIHHNLSLGMLIKTESCRSGDILKYLLFKGYELNVKVKFSPVEPEDYDRWVK